MNLYVVSDITNDWCCFAITTTIGRAKVLVMEEFSLEGYNGMRAQTIAKNVDNLEKVISTEYKEGYHDIVLKYCKGYTNEGGDT
jgi:hypothetical protein